MTIQEYLLVFFSRKPSQKDYDFKERELIPDKPLKLLEAEYANFQELIAGRKVVDFGCGKGHQSIELVKKYNCQVIGIDTNNVVLEKAISRAFSSQIPEAQLSFTSIPSPN